MLKDCRFNLLGQVAVTTGISFGLAGLISTTATVKNPDYVPSAEKTIGIYAAILISHGLINTFGVRILRYLNNTSIVLHSLGIFSLMVAILAKAPTHQSGTFVFSTFNDGTGTEDIGWSQRASPAYVAVCGVLITQYTITGRPFVLLSLSEALPSPCVESCGDNLSIEAMEQVRSQSRISEHWLMHTLSLGFDASAHLSEETQKASWSAPLGVIMSVGVSALFGFFVILGLLFSIQDFGRTVSSTYGQPVLQILVDIFGPDGAVALMTLIMLCVWHCGLFSMTSNSRMMFAFSRDHALPRFFHKVDQKHKSPVRTVWLAAFLSFCLALPSLGSTVAFAAATSIATIGLYISYGIPILIGAIYHDTFVKGPFNLGVFSRPVAFIGTTWIGFIAIVFCLPTGNPVTSQTVNYTPAAVGIIGLWVAASWLLWARTWFTGPIRQIAAEQAGIDISEPGALEMAEEKGAI